MSKNLHKENYKTLLKDTKVDLNKWEDSQWFWIAGVRGVWRNMGE